MAEDSGDQLLLLSRGGRSVVRSGTLPLPGRGDDVVTDCHFTRRRTGLGSFSRQRYGVVLSILVKASPCDLTVGTEFKIEVPSNDLIALQIRTIPNAGATMAYECRKCSSLPDVQLTVTVEATEAISAGVAHFSPAKLGVGVHDYKIGLVDVAVFANHWARHDW